MSVMNLQDGYEDELGQLNSIRGQLVAFADNVADALKGDNKIDAAEALRFVPSAVSIGLSVQTMLLRADPGKRDRLLFALRSGQLVLPE